MTCVVDSLRLGGQTGAVARFRLPLEPPHRILDAGLEQP